MSLTAAGSGDAIEDVVAARRLASRDATGAGEARHAFTVAKTPALLQLRARPREPWAWVIELSRAANLLSKTPALFVAEQRHEGLSTVTLELRLPGGGRDEIDLRDLLGAALEAEGGLFIDRGAQGWDTVPPEPERRAYARALLGAAVNAALGEAPLAIEVRVPGAGRRLARRADVRASDTGLEDPYAVSNVPGLDVGDLWIVRVERASTGGGVLGGIASWFGGSARPLDAIARHVEARLVGGTRERLAGTTSDGSKAVGFDLSPFLPGPALELGRHARLGPLPPSEGSRGTSSEVVWVSEGVRRLRLDKIPGFPPGLPASWIECPTLRLTADETSIAKDDAWELLVAWAHDALAHTFDVPPHEGAAPQRQVLFPTALSSVPAVSGRAVSLDQLAARVTAGGDILYVWHHEAHTIDASVAATVLKLWPSELRLLEIAFPTARFVPARAFTGSLELSPVDLTALAQGSLAPLRWSTVLDVIVGPGRRERIELDVYVHRHAHAVRGSLVLLAFERRVAIESRPEATIPGCSLVARLRVDVGRRRSLGELRADKALHAAVFTTMLQTFVQGRDDVLGHVLSVWREATFVEVATAPTGASKPAGHPLGFGQPPAARGLDLGGIPFLHTVMAEVDPSSLGLAYVMREGRPTLSWRASPVLDVPVARTRSGTPRDLRHVLERLQRHGVIVRAGDKPYPALESEDPWLEPLWLDTWAMPLLERVAGRAALVTMPVVPEALPSPELVAREPGRPVATILDVAEVERLRSRAALDPIARDRLAAHVLARHQLVARGIDRGGSMADARLDARSSLVFGVFDPRAAAPLTLLSLDRLLELQPRPEFVFPSLATRQLTRPVVEARPGIAVLLHEVLQLSPHQASITDSSAIPTPAASASARAPLGVRRAASVALVTMPVRHPWCTGVLRISGDGASEGITTWMDGLAVGKFTLPEPLGRVSGRLWVQRGVDLRRLEGEAAAMARDLFAIAFAHRSLTLPDSERRRRLDAFFDYVAATTRHDDPHGLRVLVGMAPAGADIRVALARAQRDQPLRKLPTRLEAWFFDALVQCLGVPIHLERSMLSWRLLQLHDRGTRGFTLDVGLRNATIHAALDPGSWPDRETARTRVFSAVALVIGEFMRTIAKEGKFEVTPSDREVALLRLLTLMARV